MSLISKVTSSYAYKSLSICFLFGLFTSQCAVATEINVIALFGDSITVGENNDFPLSQRPGNGGGRLANDGLSPILPPTNKLSDLLVEERRESSVVNWGIGGSGSNSGASRISGNLATTQSAFPANNYYVLILYGTNDFSRGLSQSDTRFNTALMIDRARAQGFVPVIGTLTPRADRNVSSYNTQIVAAANSRGAAVVDHYSRFLQDGNNGLSLLDTEFFGGQVLRLHPTSEGYDVIASTWFDQFLITAIAPEPDRVDISPIISLVLSD